MSEDIRRPIDGDPGEPPRLGTSTPDGAAPSGTTDSAKPENWVEQSIGVAFIASIAVIGIFGWTVFFQIVLWGVMVIASLLAIGGAVTASESQDEAERSSLWIGAVVSAVVAVVAWFLVPTRGNDPAATAAAQALLRNVSPQGRRTYDFWIRLHAIDLSPLQNARDSASAVRAVRNISQNIAQLPTAGVDIEAVECGNAIRVWFSKTANEIERNNSASFFLENFLRGFTGDVAGPLMEAMQASSASQREWSALLERVSSTRSILSARYGVEFPAL